MTTIIIANSITAGIVVLGLVAVLRLGHLTAGGRFERTPRRLELQPGSEAGYETPERRAA
jgi:hypothetical protein